MLHDYTVLPSDIYSYYDVVVKHTLYLSWFLFGYSLLSLFVGSKPLILILCQVYSCFVSQTTVSWLFTYCPILVRVFVCLTYNFPANLL